MFKKLIISICLLSLISSPLLAFKMPSIESKPRVIGGAVVAGVSAFSMLLYGMLYGSLSAVQKKVLANELDLGELKDKKMNQIRTSKQIAQFAFNLEMEEEEVAELTYEEALQKWANSCVLKKAKRIGAIGLGVSSAAMIASIALIVSGLK